ncbi:MAG: tRNA pseudouridine(38-40) synthase TruA [Candidatus Omnitrophica bacterium]|nr:tRNA pseudouridine(38-40) synthase TruA [Candidatus Omnitrophota bacterium]
MQNFRLTIEYDGTNFNGWQTQAQNCRTVQGEIQKALKIIFKKNITLIGSGRTDSGVHALGQTAHLKIKTAMPTDEILRALNANLPDDISIINVEEMPLKFHAQYGIKTKTYRYTILNRPSRSPQQRNFCLFYPYKLNLKVMKEEAKVLVGKHNFKSFQSTDPARPERGEDSVRTIKRLDIKKKDGRITIDIEADGFLYKMVRSIVGTLIEVGRGKLAKGSMKKILSAKDRSCASPTAPAKGLCLWETKY